MDETTRLIAGLRERDITAFEVLYDRYHRLVFGVAQRILGDATSAEDLVQGVFLKLWSSPEAFREGNFGAWIARVARNAALDVLRSKAVRAVDEMPADLAVEGTIDDVVFARIDGDRVRRALSELPDDQRVPIELGFFGGITHEKIAERLDVPLGTVKTRIRTGLRKLRTQLEARVAP